MAWNRVARGGLHFKAEYSYQSTPDGILIPVQIAQVNQKVDLIARLDTGAADCLFDQFFAETLGLDVEAGLPQKYRTVSGSFTAFGHEVTLRSLGMEWTAMVYFYAAASPGNNFLGRRGWLDRVRLGLVHYDQLLLVSEYR